MILGSALTLEPRLSWEELGLQELSHTHTHTHTHAHTDTHIPLPSHPKPAKWQIAPGIREKPSTSHLRIVTASVPASTVTGSLIMVIRSHIKT